MTWKICYQELEVGKRKNKFYMDIVLFILCVSVFCLHSQLWEDTRSSVSRVTDSCKQPWGVVGIEPQLSHQST